MWSDPLRYLIQKLRGNRLPSWRYEYLNDRLIDVANLDRALADVKQHPALTHSPRFHHLVADAKRRFPEELKQAVFLYTGDTPLFQELNRVLRTDPVDWNTPDFEAKFRYFASYIPFLLRGLQDECPVHPADMPLYRLMSGNPFEVGTANPRLHKGRRWISNAFLSCSSSSETLWALTPGFVGATDVYTLLTLNNCPHGHAIQHLSLFAHESEVLLPPHISFKVDGIVRRRPTPHAACLALPDIDGKIQPCSDVLCAKCHQPRDLAVIEVTLSFLPSSSNVPGMIPGTNINQAELPQIEVMYAPKPLPVAPKPLELPKAPEAIPIPSSPPRTVVSKPPPPTRETPSTAVGHAVIPRPNLPNLWSVSVLDCNTGTYGFGKHEQFPTAQQIAYNDLHEKVRSHYDQKHAQALAAYSEQMKNSENQVNQSTVEHQRLEQEIQRINQVNKQTYDEQVKKTQAKYHEDIIEHKHRMDIVLQANAESEQQAIRQAHQQQVQKIHTRVKTDIKDAARFGAVLSALAAMYSLSMNKRLRREQSTTKDKVLYIVKEMIRGALKGGLTGGVCSASYVSSSLVRNNAVISLPLIGTICSMITDLMLALAQGNPISIGNIVKVWIKNLLVGIASAAIVKTVGRPVFGLPLVTGCVGGYVISRIPFLN